MLQLCKQEEREKMNRKFIDILFAALVFSLPFGYIPRALWQTILGGPYGHDLVLYPIIIGFLYTAYCQWKYRDSLIKWGVFKKFILIYIAILLISLVWGLFNYPYYDQILNGPADQIEKLPKALAILHGIGISLEEKTMLEIWMFARPIKGVLFEAFYTFGAAYMIFCWYHDRVQRAIDILLKVTTVDLMIVAAYGLIDVCYQNGQMWAQNALIFLNPLIHADVLMEPTALEFHPLMFRDAQNRSLFLEPSYFGIYMAFAYPILWWEIFRSQHKIKKLALWILFSIITFELFLAQSRLALAVNFGVLGLFVLFCLYRYQKEWLILIASLFICGGIALGGAMAFLQYGQVPSIMADWTPLASKWIEMQDSGITKGDRDIQADDYFKEGLGSLSSNYNGVHAGSNHTRMTVMKTNFEIGREHPALGVGTSMRVAYLREKLDNDQGEEIRQCNRRVDELGVLRGSYGNLGDYAVRFAETGFLGLGVFLLPSIVLLYRSKKFIFDKHIESSIIAPMIFPLLSFVGIMSTGLGDGLNFTFCGWLMMAIGYLYLKELKNLSSSH